MPDFPNTLPGRSALLMALSLAAGCASTEQGAMDPDLLLTTVPTPAEYVSGGQTLLRIDGAEGEDLSALAISLNGADATAEFRPAPDDWLDRPQNALLGMLTGLQEGENTVEVRRDGDLVGTLNITNYPIDGPIFSGPHLEPYLCLDEIATDGGTGGEFEIGNGETLGGSAEGDSCGYPTRVDWVYWSDEGEDWAPLDPSADLPEDIAQINTRAGAAPFVVRLETGTINRAIYQTAIVADPRDPEPGPWSPPAAWNGRLIYTFGGGCEAGFFQGTTTGGVLRESMLREGYAIASSTLNVNAQGGCNDPLSAETAMMVKERFAESYGPPVHTIGNGGSGGAMQQLLIAGAYPGILNGIMPTLTFPDAVSYLIDSVECYPIRDQLNQAGWDEESKRVIGGWARWYTCETSLGERPNRGSPYDCPSQIPASQAFDERSNPTGIRCSIYDGMRAVFGTMDQNGMTGARNPHDNVGVQYGLRALEQGLISKAQFLAVNERIGGWDWNWNRTEERAQGDTLAARAAYETGRITSGTGGLAVTPIIDERVYLDDSGNFHTSYYSFVMRERLIRDTGNAENYVLQRHPTSISLAEENLALMDEWLSTIARDDTDATLPQKIARARPADLVDACWDDEGNRIVEDQSYDEGRIFDNTAGPCNAALPPHAGPRMVAGGPLTNDVLKCRLKPLDRSDYSVEFTDAEWARMQEIFPTGVCDWSQPGVGQVPQVGTWLSFGPSPVNRYTPPASGSQP